MNWPPDIADELPTPRDDEPSSLRQDIADELADHLQSSFVGELHRTPEETKARQHVLERFGDPRRVAQQLWFDAMKEKIMSQRVNLVISSLMTAACLGALGLMTVMLRDSREVNAAILERLAALAAPQPAPAAVPVQNADSAKSLDWVRPKFKLVLGERGGPPAVGYKVQLQAGQGGAVLGETEKNGIIYPGMVEEAAGADGVVDLGLFRFGAYLLTVTTPWGESTSRQVGLRPGQEPTREIVCPAAAPEEADVAFSVDWPDDLRDMQLRLICNFMRGTRRIGAETWSLAVPGFDYGTSVINNQFTQGMLVINSDGKSAILRVMHHQSRDGDETANVSEQYEFVNQPDFVEQQQMPALLQRFNSLKIIREQKEEGFEGFRVLASMSGGMGMGGMGGGMGGGFFNIADKAASKETAGADSLSFMSCELKAGQVNQWKIRLPEFVLDQIRIKLGLKPDPAAVEPKAY
ncbi:MAG TPA: hypothetical protein VGH74_21315 [Planctomycetaceae bacterium]